MIRRDEADSGPCPLPGRGPRRPSAVASRASSLRRRSSVKNSSAGPSADEVSSARDESSLGQDLSPSTMIEFARETRQPQAGP